MYPGLLVDTRKRKKTEEVNRKILVALIKACSDLETVDKNRTSGPRIIVRVMMIR
jgi:hypothetical protein